MHDQCMHVHAQCMHVRDQHIINACMCMIMEARDNPVMGPGLNHIDDSLR